MAERPSGTVTFLFSDIEGSTRLLREIGAERYRAVLEEHRRLMRESIAAASGVEIDTEGDAFFVAFHRAEDAVRAAVDAQRRLGAQAWPDGRQVRVRMGIHTTEAIAAAEGYVGIGVHRGARICAAAYGGQVLVSHATADLLGDADLPVRLIDLGLHRLKDIAEPEHLFQIGADGLAEGFPPLRSLQGGSTNLPSQPTPLIGRRHEVDEVVATLRAGARMLTLTGAGGSGKTRLALQAAAEVLGDHADGVFYVPLATITDPALVLPAIAEALRISAGAGQALDAYLEGRQLLLVVDNVEQVAGAAPDLAALLADAPDVQMLLTSREPLRVAIERVLPVEPLGADDAASLFVERATAVLPTFGLTDENWATVAEICARLDRLPLAIELAAARITVLSPEAMLGRLGERLKLLTSSARDQPTRHQTLRNTLAWSYDLLTDAERNLLAQFSVFAGSFTLEAAETVTGTDLDGIGSLVDRSLIRRSAERYEMLATIREYAAEKLAEQPEAEAVHERHAAFFESLTDHAFADRYRDQAAMADLLAADHDDVRETLDWLSRTDSLRFARMASKLGWFWHAHSHFIEGRTRIAAALGRVPGGDGEDRARLLSAATELAAWYGDSAQAEAFGADAMAAWTALGRDEDVALVLYDLGWGQFFAGENDAARERMEASLAKQQAHGDLLLINRAQLGLLQVLVAVGDVETVKRIGPEALSISQQLDDRWSEHFAHHFLGDVAVMEGDVAEAERRYRLSLEAAWQTGDQAETGYELQGMAMAAAGKGEAERALRLASAADANIRKLGVEQLPPFWASLIDRHVEIARNALGEERANAAWGAGRALSLQAAVELALQLPTDSQAAGLPH